MLIHICKDVQHYSALDSYSLRATCFFLRMPHALLVVLHINPQGANPRMWHTFIDEDAMRWVKGNLADIV